MTLSIPRANSRPHSQYPGPVVGFCGEWAPDAEGTWRSIIKNIIAAWTNHNGQTPVRGVQLTKNAQANPWKQGKEYRGAVL